MLSSCIVIEQSRLRTLCAEKHRTTTPKYYLPKDTLKNQVCKTIFLQTFCINDQVLKTVRSKSNEMCYCYQRGKALILQSNFCSNKKHSDRAHPFLPKASFSLFQEKRRQLVCIPRAQFYSSWYRLYQEQYTDNCYEQNIKLRKSRKR